jgi:ribosomal protein S18 acetylase RimI-like enzyme
MWIQAQPATTANQLHALLAVAKRRATASTHRVGGILREDWLPAGWEDVASHSGYALMLPMISMEAEALAPPRRPLATLDIVRIDGDGAARDLAALNAAAYNMPIDMFECLATGTFWSADCYAYVGYVNAQPVSSSVALPVDRTVYIAFVATAPDEQRKGYAETVMRHAVLQGQRAMHVRRTTLHATEMGRPLHSAMGYVSGPRMLLVEPTE